MKTTLNPNNNGLGKDQPPKVGKRFGPTEVTRNKWDMRPDGVRLPMHERKRDLPPELDRADELMIKGSKSPAEVTQHCEARLRAEHAFENEQAESDLAPLQLDLERNAQAHASLTARLREVQPEGPDRYPTHALPKGSARWKAAGYIFLAGGIALVGWANLAQFAVNVTQQWLMAFLCAFPLVIFPISLKDLQTSGNGASRPWSQWGLALVGVATFAFYLWQFAKNFAQQPSVDQIVTGQNVSVDMAPLLVAQVALEMVTNVALLWAIRQMTVPVAIPVPNPAYARLHGLLKEVEQEIARAEKAAHGPRAVLSRFENGLKAYVQEATVLFEAYQEDLQKAAARARQVRRLDGDGELAETNEP